ncbi:hypothetical protein SUDANB37_04599 [Streptomyces sp. enrichment culture]
MHEKPGLPADLTDALLNPAPSVHVLEVSGDRWTGKTTLLAQLADEAEKRGWRVTAGRAAVQPGARAPFGLFHGVIDGLLPANGSGPAGNRQDESAHSAPGGFPGHGGGVPGLRDDPVVLYQYFHSLRTRLEAAASSRGLLVVLDDVHWADEGSLELLEHFIRNPPRGTVVLALAHRPRQSSLHLHAVLNEAVRDSRACRVVPPRLSDEEAGALLPEDISRAQSSLLLEESGHNPGVLKAFAAMRLTLRPQWASTVTLPVEVLAEVLRDFHALSPLGWRVAHAAAILDEPFRLNVLQAVSQTDDDEILAAIDELAGQDIFEADEDARHLRFSKSLLKAAAHQSTGPGWLLGAHARAARSLARQRTDDVRLAEHLQFQIAGNDSRASRLLLEAATRHRWTDATDACAWAEAALSIGDAAGDSDDDETRAATVLGSALALSGKLRRGLEVLARATGGAQPAGRGAEALLWTAWARQMLGEAEVAERDLAQAVRTMTGLGPDDRAALLAGWVSCLLHLDRLVPSETVTELLGLSEVSTAAARMRGHALTAMATLRESGPSARARARTKAAARLLEPLRDDDLVEHLDGLYWLGRAEAELDDPEAAAARLERGLNMAECRRFHTWVPLFAGALARVESGAGDPQNAVRHASVALAAANRTDSSHLWDRADRFHAGLSAAGSVRSATVGCFLVRDTPEQDGHGRTRPEETGALDLLSKRELQIAVLVSNGRTNQQIARELVVSPKTVETHLGRIFKKLAVASRAEVAACVGRSYDGRVPLGRAGLDAPMSLSSKAAS